ncbi:MAG: GAF domain-containing protein [Acidimicrobiales bacterium]
MADDLTLADLEALLETGRALSEEVELKTLLDRILEQACLLTDSPDASVLLHDPSRDVLYFAAVSGANAATLLDSWGFASDRAVPISSSVAGKVFTTGEPLVVDSVEGEDDHFGGVDRDTRAETRSLVCLPLRVGARRLGVVQLLNKRTGNYASRDLVLLEHLARQAAVAIRNAQLFDDLLSHMGLYGLRAPGVGPAELLDELRRPPHPEVLSVLVADMRNYTKLSQVLERPEQTFDRLDEFLGLLARSVLANGGVVNKFLGDGVLAFFRDADHSTRAVTCAFDIVKGFGPLRDAWDEASNTPLGFLDVGVAVTTDSVVLGAVGTSRVRDFTAMGTAVTLATSLADRARDGKRVLVDRQTLRQARRVVAAYDGPEVIDVGSPGEHGRSFEYFVLRLPEGDGPAPAGPPPGGRRATDRPPDVFVSYSHKDARWLDRLRTHLKPYVRSGRVTVWDDGAIGAGDEWFPTIGAALASAKVAVLLVSPNFLASDFIAEHELLPLLSAAREEGKRILWVPVSESAWRETDIRRFQAVGDAAHPLDSLDEAECNRVLVEICRTIVGAPELA